MLDALEDGLLEKKMPLLQVPSNPTRQFLSILKATLRYTLDVARPMFLTRSPPSSRTPKLRRTAYLDGLRGFAALLVYWMHNILWSHGMGIKILESPYGWDNRYHFVTLPFVRIFFTGGHFAVAIFYVISGYVLTTKPLSLIQAGKYAELGDNLASALFRRWLRLFIPVIATTFVYMSVWHAAGISPPPPSPPAKDTYGEELWHWYVQLKNFSFLFKDEPVPWTDYNTHSWSIPLEYQGSIIVFTACMAFARCTTNKRLLLEIGLILYFYTIVNGWYCALFMSGMLLGDLDLLALNDALPLKSLFASLKPYKTLLWYLVFIFSLYLGGVPTHEEDMTEFAKLSGWHYLSYLKPSAVKDVKWAFLFWAATFLVACVPRISWLKSFFESRFCQYLGRISFSLYLVHGPVIWIFADRMYAAFGLVSEWQFDSMPNWVNRVQGVPMGGPLALELPFLIPHFLVVMPFTFWLAEVTTRLFDETSVRFTQWLYRSTLPIEEDEKVGR